MSEEIVVKQKKSEAQHHRKPKKIVIPRRVPSAVVPPTLPIYITPDKTTCVECSCFPPEDPYVKNKKLNPCQKSPITLYELAANIVDVLEFPHAFGWSENDVADWMEREVGFPEYRECILTNHINGRRLIWFEDPSVLAEMKIKNFYHVQVITKMVRQLYKTEFIKFCRSIGLPPRKPLTHCTWFKSRTGPSWGIRQNWSRCDILRWMKIIGPEPVYRDHWDLVWYQKPDFPRVLFGRMEEQRRRTFIPHYKPKMEICREYLAPRRFKIQRDISDSKQYIWMEYKPEPKKKPKIETKIEKKEESRLLPKKINLTGLSGKQFILAKRKTPKPKFLE